MSTRVRTQLMPAIVVRAVVRPKGNIIAMNPSILHGDTAQQFDEGDCFCQGGR
jgi:hypothetical protein